MSNINEFFHSTIGGDEAISGGEGFPIDFKCSVICAYDCRKELTWGEIDGVRRIQEIKYYSDSVNLVSQSNFYIKRTFLYAANFPRDLYEITDVLVPL
jgi:hypothetical protein